MTSGEPSAGRLENLLGAWALRAVTTLDRALADASGLAAAADRAALVSLLNLTVYKTEQGHEVSRRDGAARVKP